MTKDIIYIDVDDEITGVIAKIEASKAKLVALVLPKNANIMSSSVNMKLLKKAEDTLKKSIVMISTDPSVLALAGAARLHVAKTLKSKPVLPALPKNEDDSDIISGDDIEKVVPTAVGTAGSEQDDIIQLDNTLTVKKSAAASAYNKKLKVPDFNRFRVKVFLITALVIGLTGSGVYAFIIAPRATIRIKTEVTKLETTADITANTSVTEFDPATSVLPAKLVEIKKNDSVKVPATGKKDIGEKATGPMTLINCTDSAVTVPAGTSFTNSGYSFTLDADTLVPESDFFSNGNCKKNGRANSTVTAVKAGGDSNLSSGRDYVSSFATTLTGLGGAMGGGTSSIITVVSQADIDGAKAKLAGSSKTDAINELKEELSSADMFALEETITDTPPKYTFSASVDTEATDVTVASETTYTMLGVTLGNIQSIIEKNLTEKITDSRQKILNNGLDKKTLQLIEKRSPTEQRFRLAVVADIGPDVDTAAIATEMAGKPRIEIQRTIAARAGIKEVVVEYEPFWVGSTPRKADKISVVVEQIIANE